MKLKLFRVLWGIDALICAVIAIFFFLGIVDGSVSSFNIGIWIGIWAALVVILGGSLWLKEIGHPIFGIILLLVLAIPGLLCGLFIFLVVLTNTPWN